MRPADRVLERLDGVERRNGYHIALCPAHDDQTPSLSITEGDDGRSYTVTPVVHPITSSSSWV
jgi:hypothetical protein